MGSSGPVVFAEDLATIPWQEVVEETGTKECFEYCNRYCSRASAAEATSDAQSLRVYALLARVTSFIFKLDEQDTPLWPVERLASFSIDELDVLAASAPSITDPELRARVADILWLCSSGRGGKRNYQMGQLAVRAYLESARHLEDPKAWVFVAERVERALQIAASLGKAPKNQLYVDAITYVEELLDRYHGDDPLFLSAEMMKLLQAQRQGDPAKYAALAEHAALRAETEHEWHRARTYWETKAQWHVMAKDEVSRRDALIHASETYVQEGEDRIGDASSGHMVAAHFYEQAIAALRRVGGMQERTTQLHQTLLAYQETGVQQFTTFTSSVQIDIGETMDLARQRVQDGSLHDALLSLAFIGPPPSFRRLEERVMGMAKASPLLSFMPRVIVSERGRNVGRIFSSTSDDAGEAQQAREALMFEAAIQDRHLHVIALVEPARDQINTDYNIRIADFYLLVANNPFIPSGHEYTYARGLYAGMTGDFLVATHLLIPQLENSVRVILEQQGVITSTLDDFGRQDDQSLNTTLVLPEAATLFGEDAVFDLRGLLIERSGSNLRNLLAHGLLKDGVFLGTEAVYCWWIILRLCCNPILMALQQHDAAAQTGYVRKLL